MTQVDGLHLLEMIKFQRQTWRWEYFIVLISLLFPLPAEATRWKAPHLSLVRLRQNPRYQHETTADKFATGRDDAARQGRNKFAITRSALPTRGGSAAIAMPLLATTGSACTTSMSSLSQSIRVALAGGIAGAVGTALLYPMDAAKTLRQSNPSQYTSVRHAFMDLLFSGNSRTSAACAATASANTAASNFGRPRVLLDALRNRLTITKAYRGVLPATIGAIPSSALYFGAYETCKSFLQPLFRVEGETSTGVSKSYQRRLLVHALAAASGNALSSIIFVPKEVIKNQIQFQHSIAASQFARAGWTRVLVEIIRTKGVGGLYCGYQATLMRNIPSAILRFCIYEELKWKWHTSRQQQLTQAQQLRQRGPRLPRPMANVLSSTSLKIFMAGALAGALASGLMTPLDVVKTRLATGTCPLDVQPCFLHVLRQDGWSGLYAGAGSRMLWSGAFSAIGFGTFEWAKSILGVGGGTDLSGTASNISVSTSYK